ncbi:MAG: hypothetical protein LBU09_05680, partial [Endomicrobium sp.]|nr:hypothetical protein [Endomicrobium sp.]
KFMHISGGGTGASFLGISEYVNSLDSSGEIGRLKGKKARDLKICAINIDGLSVEVCAKELPFAFNARYINAFELSLLNGVRACRSFGKSGGLALMNPASVYIGNMLAKGDITIISAMESYDEILKHEMPWVISEGGRVKKTYYNFDIRTINDFLEKKGLLARTGGLENRRLRQFETTTGNILFKFENKDLYSSFFNEISKLYKNIYKNSLGDENMPAIDFIRHILIPALRMKNGEDALSYFTKLGIDKELGGFYEEYASFFDSALNEKFRAVIGGLTINSYMQPHSFYAPSGRTVLPEDILSKPYMPQTQLSDASENDFVNAKDDAYRALYRLILETRFHRKLYFAQRMQTANVYRGIIEKTGNNIRDIERYLNSGREISLRDREMLLNLKKLFISLQFYSLEYLKTLDAVENISVLGGYIFPETSFFERSKIMPINRAIFGMRKNFKKEKEKLFKQAYRLYSLGNELSPLLYDYNSLLKDFEEYAREKEKPNPKTYLGIEKNWGDRKAIQRILSLIIAFQSIIYTIALAVSSAVNGTPFTYSGVVGDVLLSLCTGVGMSIFLHRFMIFLGRRGSSYTAAEKELSSFDEEHFKNLSYFSDEEQILKAIAKDLSEVENLSRQTDTALKARSLKNKIKAASVSLAEINRELSGILSDLSSDGRFISVYSSLSAKSSYLPKEDNPPMEVNETLQNNITQSSHQYIQRWENALKSGGFGADKFEIVRRYALQLIKIIVFSKDSFELENKEKIISVLWDFSVLYNDTLKKIDAMPFEEKEKCRMETESFQKAGEYVQAYYKVLSHALNADILNSYRISKGAPLYFFEQIKVMPAVRYIMGINFGIYYSNKGFMKSVGRLISAGNALMPGLYDEEKLLEFSRKYIENKLAPKRFDIGITEFWKIRKMLTRLFPLLFFLRSVIAGNLWLEPSRLFTAFITGVGISIFMHWAPILYGLLDAKIKKIV